MALNEFKNIPNSRHAKCVLQRAIAEHNSKLDTLKSGEEKVYKAPAAKCRGLVSKGVEKEPS